MKRIINLMLPLHLFISAAIFAAGAQNGMPDPGLAVHAAVEDVLAKSLGAEKSQPFSLDGKTVAIYRKFDGAGHLWSYSRIDVPFLSLTPSLEKADILVAIRSSESLYRKVSINGAPAEALNTDWDISIIDLKSSRCLVKSLKYSRSPSLIPGMSMRSMELTGRAPVEDLQSYLAARISGLIVPCYRPTSVAALPDKNLFVADGDSDLNVYSCETGQKVKTVKTGSLRPITALELSGSGRVLAAGMADGRVFLYSSPALSLVKRLEGSAGSGLMRIAFSPDESLLACCAEKVLVVWSLSSGSILARFVNPGHGSICGAVISPDNKHVLARTGESEYRVWNLARKEEVKKIDYVNGFMKTFHDGSICFPSVFVNAGAFFEQVLSDTDQPLPQRMESYIRSNPGGGGMTNHSSAIDMALSRKGDMLAAGGYSVVLYDRAAMRKMGEFGGYAEKAVSIDFSWDGRHLITVDGRGVIKIWDLKDRLTGEKK